MTDRETVERVAHELQYGIMNHDDMTEAAALLRALRARLTEEYEAGYILAMRLLQSNLTLDDEERVAIELFLPQSMKRVGDR